MIRILGVSDIHPKVDGVYSGKLRVDPSSGLSEAFIDCQRSLAAILAWENEHPCDLAVIPGDLFDRDRPTPDEYMLIERFLLALLARMSVVIIPGNHDMDQKGIKASAVEPLALLGKDHGAASSPHQLHVLSNPESVTIATSNGRVCVAGLPFPSKGRFKASGEVEEGSSPEVVMQRMNEELYKSVAKLATTLDPTAPNIMIAHGTVANASVGEQPRVITHDLMIPLELMDFYDLVLLGHIHKHQWVAPNALYCGSLLCQTIGERDEVKGWIVAEVEKGEKPNVQHIRNPCSRRFFDLNLEDLDDTWSGESVYRVVGEVAIEKYPEACLNIAKFEQRHPFTQNDLTLIRPDDRVRDSTVTVLMDEDEAIKRVLMDLVPEEEIPAVMGLHTTLTEGVSK